MDRTPPTHIDANTRDHSCLIGSFEHDAASGYSLNWDSLATMESWMLREEEKHTVEFIKKQTVLPTSSVAHLWTKNKIYVCARNYSGGRSTYKKKHDWDRAVPGKKLDGGCPCQLTVKTYPYTHKVLGKYTDNHSHDLGNTNTRFTRLQKETQEEIESLLRLGVEPQKVVRDWNVF